jgi:hypothetical protein
MVCDQDLALEEEFMLATLKNEKIWSKIGKNWGNSIEMYHFLSFREKIMLSNVFFRCELAPLEETWSVGPSVG